MTRPFLSKIKSFIFSPYLLIAIIALALLAAFPQLSARYRMEQADRTVDLLLPYGELLEQVQQRGSDSFTTAEALHNLRAAGIGGLLFREQSIKELHALGELQYFEGKELQAAYLGGRASGWINALGEAEELFPGRLYLEIYDWGIWQRANYYLSNKYEDVTVHRSAAGPGRPGVLSLPGDFYRWEVEGLGFPAAEIEAAAAQGFNIYLQLAYWPDADAKSIPRLLEPLQQLPQLSGILFRDSQLPGIPEHTAVLAGELEKLAAPIVAVEFFDRQAPNLNRLVRALEHNEILRLHAITRGEMEELPVQRILQRFRLAAAERNNQLLLLRFAGEKLTGTAWLDYNTAVCQEMGTTLHSAGFETGTPAPFTSLPFSRLNMMLLGAGVAAAAVLLLRRLNFSPALATALGAGGLLVTAALLLRGGSVVGFDTIELVRKALALAAALVFPILAILVAGSWFGNRSLRNTTSAFALMAAVSLAGALLLSALCSDLLYMVKLDQFGGVKAALSLPPLFLFLYFSLHRGPGAEAAKRPAATVTFLISLWERLRRFLGQPLLVGTTLAAVALLVLLYIYISRAGNESLFVSDLELRLRLLLDDLLVVRPRTKEFLIGHPFMLLALYYGYRFRGGAVLVALGAIGQVSLINSFAHLHTPLLITLIRTFWGLGLGILLGLAAILVLNALFRYLSALGKNAGSGSE